MAEYEPTWEALDKHPVPEWYEDAKLGIFIHWYPNSVPGYGFGWYAHDMHLPDPEDQNDEKDVHAYHREHYGAPTEEMAGEGEPVFEYKDFVRETDMARDPEAPENFDADAFDPEAWADLFARAGARYVVPVAEHHDGFPMWDADYTDWTAVEMGPERDVIADLADAIRDRDMKFAGSHHRMYCFYDPRYEGLFGHPDYDGPVDPRTKGTDGPGEAFVEEWLDTVERMLEHHEPDLLWLDGDWGADADTFRSKELLATYYNKAEEWDKEVVANDRLGRTRWNDDEPHGDFYTPEYAKFERTVAHKWETCRSLGDAWTYDRAETGDDLLSVTQLVRNFVDVVSKNGNLLINVGPHPDGTIPEIQAERLLGLGDWLSINGEGIYGTRYWVTPEDETGGVAIRYTTADEHVYAFLFGWPDEARLTLAGQVEGRTFEVHLLTSDGTVDLGWTVEDDDLVIELPDEPPAGTHEAAYGLRVRVAPAGVDAVERATVEPDVVESTTGMQALVADDYDASDWEL